MKWKQPPIIKIYEALGVVADGRIEVSDNTAKVYFSTGNKFYDVSYEPEIQSIMTNDNGSYWQNYLGYPAIAYLLKTGVLEYKSEYGNMLKGVAWKDINQKFKNHFEKTLGHILSSLSSSEAEKLKNYIEELEGNINSLNLNLLGKKTMPPEGY